MTPIERLNCEQALCRHLQMGPRFRELADYVASFDGSPHRAAVREAYLELERGDPAAANLSAKDRAIAAKASSEARLSAREWWAWRALISLRSRMKRRGIVPPAAVTPQAPPTTAAEALRSIHGRLASVLQRTRQAHFVPDGYTAERYLGERRGFIVAWADLIRQELTNLRRVGFAVPEQWKSWLPQPSGQATILPSGQGTKPCYGWSLANYDDVADFASEVEVAMKALAGKAQAEPKAAPMAETGWRSSPPTTTRASVDLSRIPRTRRGGMEGSRVPRRWAGDGTTR